MLHNLPTLEEREPKKVGKMTSAVAESGQAQKYDGGLSTIWRCCLESSCRSPMLFGGCSCYDDTKSSVVGIINVQAVGPSR